MGVYTESLSIMKQMGQAKSLMQPYLISSKMKIELMDFEYCCLALLKAKEHKLKSTNEACASF